MARPTARRRSPTVFVPGMRPGAPRRNLLVGAFYLLVGLAVAGALLGT